MDERARGQRAVRTLTDAVALGGLLVAGALGVTTYAGIQSAKAAAADHTTTTPSARGSDDDAVPSAPSTAPSASAPQSVGAGSGSAHSSSGGS